ncbi:MAG: mannose-1-phosphate guanylyltransferase [Candidatus Kapaibacteriota bacterium]
MEKVAIIMAGGSGNRFWPLSRISRPKQLIKFEEDGTTLLEAAIQRAQTLMPVENVFIITNQYLQEPIRNLLPNLPEENVIAEPLKRNTGPCLALSSSIISARFEQKGLQPSDILVSVLTADQRIFPTEAFTKTVEPILRFVQYNNVLATIGIRPVRPETGYGYIEVEDEFDYSTQNIQIKPLKSFHEKPNSDTAAKYFASRKFLWNSGMFFWKLDVFNTKFLNYYPIIGEKIDSMTNILKNNPYNSDLTRNKEILNIYSNFPDISIDYALLEKAKKIVVAKATFSWEDLGSYDALPRIYPVDDAQNYIKGNTTLIDVNESIIINDTTKNKDMILTVLGLKKIVAVVTDDAVMLCPKDRVQEVKRIVEKLNYEGKTNWL